jgi:hypothetical protein
MAGLSMFPRVLLWLAMWPGLLGQERRHKHIAIRHTNRLFDVDDGLEVPGHTSLSFFGLEVPWHLVPRIGIVYMHLVTAAGLLALAMPHPAPHPLVQLQEGHGSLLFAAKQVQQ